MQTPRQLPDHLERGITGAALDHGDEGAVQPRLIGERFLRQTGLQAARADDLTEG